MSCRFVCLSVSIAFAFGPAYPRALPVELYRNMSRRAVYFTSAQLRAITADKLRYGYFLLAVLSVLAVSLTLSAIICVPEPCQCRCSAMPSLPQQLSRGRFASSGNRFVSGSELAPETSIPPVAIDMVLVSVVRDQDRTALLAGRVHTAGCCRRAELYLSLAIQHRLS